MSSTSLSHFISPLYPNSTGHNTIFFFFGLRKAKASSPPPPHIKRGFHFPYFCYQIELEADFITNPLLPCCLSLYKLDKVNAYFLSPSCTLAWPCSKIQNNKYLMKHCWRLGLREGGYREWGGECPEKDGTFLKKETESQLPELLPPPFSLFQGKDDTWTQSNHSAT